MTDIFSVLDFYEVLKLLMGSGLYINIKLGGMIVGWVGGVGIYVIDKVKWDLRFWQKIIVIGGCYVYVQGLQAVVQGDDTTKFACLIRIYCGKEFRVEFRGDSIS